MPTFQTPEPITVTADLFAADVKIVASDRTDTVVEVRPRNKSRGADLKAVEQTRVEYTNGQLSIKGPNQRFRFGIGRRDSLEVTIQVPRRSHARVEVSMGELETQGELGECELTTAAGDIRLDHASSLVLETGAGDIVADRIAGNATIKSACGSVRIGTITNSANIKVSGGDTHIDDVTGELRLSSSYGDISIDRADGLVEARTAYGDIQINEVARGSVLLETSYGELEVGIREGTAAWLDVSTKYGNVRNDLSAGPGPRAADETAEVRARTAYGDIVVRRSTDKG